MEQLKFADFRIRGHIADTFFAKSGKIASITVEVPHRYLDGEIVRETTYKVRCTTFDRKLMDELKGKYGERDFIAVEADRFLPATPDGKGGFYQASFAISEIKMLRKAKPRPKADVLAGLALDD